MSIKSDILLAPLLSAILLQSTVRLIIRPNRLVIILLGICLSVLEVLSLVLSTIIVGEVREKRISSVAVQILILSLELFMDFVGAVAFDYGKHEHDPKHELCQV